MPLAFIVASVSIISNGRSGEWHGAVEADRFFRVNVELIALMMVRVEGHF
ncbi:hypothetical protein [Pseudomonas thivervalensis]